MKEYLRNPYILGGAGLVVAGLFTHWFRGRPDDIASKVTVRAGDLSLTEPNLTDLQARAFAAALPDLGKPYADMFVRAGRAAGISPFVMAGIMDRETRFGKGCPNLPQCKGVSGADYGLMQINRIHKEFMAKTVNGRPAYEDPWSSIEYGTNLFAQYRRYLKSKFPNLSELELLRATASSYNAGNGAVAKAMEKGKSPDSVTTGGDYGKDALQRASRLLEAARAAELVG